MGLKAPNLESYIICDVWRKSPYTQLVLLADTKSCQENWDCVADWERSDVCGLPIRAALYDSLMREP